MAISELNRRKHDIAAKAVADSNLSASLKEDLTDALESTLEATNGLTPEEKLQSSTENQFTMTRLFAITLVNFSSRTASWRDVAIAYKWPLVIMFGFLCIALIFRPELAALVESVSRNIHQ
jgi:hypothetical protein